MSTIGRQILKRRNEKHLSQEELANQSGISLRTIQRIEKGSVNPHGHTLKALAATLEIDIPAISEASENTNSLRTLNAIGYLVILFPLIHLLVQLFYWNRKITIREDKQKGSGIISFQILWLLATLVAFGLIHVISFVVAGQSAIGHFPYRLIAYLMLLLINTSVITVTAVQLSHNRAEILSRIPKLL